MVPWAHQSPQPKRHLDRFSRFAGLTSVTDRQTADRQTDIPRYSVGNNRPHVCTYGRCGLKSKLEIVSNASSALQ